MSKYSRCSKHGLLYPWETQDECNECRKERSDAHDRDAAEYAAQQGDSDSDSCYCSKCGRTGWVSNLFGSSRCACNPKEEDDGRDPNYYTDY